MDYIRIKLPLVRQVVTGRGGVHKGGVENSGNVLILYLETGSFLES